ncbi:helix-turn-helix domain-containing protein [Amycolatopsis rhabdoformis]|uniref:Helix-turn-helix domain-containing protein n=1 Tax=Amycolatopsis rhabdoformis TaxID=1448059 RepID=A0ABZ1I7I0_9PSEU|nr:helix-turn-helix domain-containing protein [Amycolatopsis rhabdoformis]WSE29931.1 helix-turn-helix domain-containing protein [Amycolatopsis rhabdoformis]
MDRERIGPLRPEIARSWQRLEAVGLSPAALVDPVPADLDPGGALRRAATPVLDDAADKLRDTAFALVLADHRGRLTDLRFGVPSLEGRMERLGAIPGATFSEDTTGTNSIATTLEEGRPVAVAGAEHYLESFRDFACYGAPLRSPTTGRIVGVLDLTCSVRDAGALLRPYVDRLARDIDERLRDDANGPNHRLLRAFEATSRRSAGPVVAFGEEVTLANRAAADLLRPADQAALRALSEDLAGRTEQRTVELVTGGSIVVRMDKLDGGVLLAVQPKERPVPIPRGRRPVPADSADWHRSLRAELDRHRDSSVLVTGEAGTGRSAVAASLAEDGGAAVIDGAETSSAELDAAFADGPRTVVLEHADHLPLRLVPRLARLRGTTRLVLTSGPAVDPDRASLWALCPVRLTLTPLRAERHRIPALAEARLREATAGRARFTLGALRVLAAADWPGNLAELAGVVDYVAARRGSGDVTEADLPPGRRRPDAGPVGGTLWQAERDAIIRALRDCEGNKVHAAERLGISRTALYRRLRVLRIETAR